MEYVTRSEFDLLNQQLRSDPGEGFAAFRAIPRILDRAYISSLTPATGGWQTFYTYVGRGGILYPDRVLALDILTGARNFDGASRTFTIRAQINGVTILTATDGIAPDATDEAGRVQFRLMSSGSNVAHSSTFECSFNPGTLDFAGNTEDMAAEWTLTLDVKWSAASLGDLWWGRSNALLTLS